MFNRSDGAISLSELERKKIEVEAREFSQEIRNKLGILEYEAIDVIPLLEKQGILVLQIMNLNTSGFIRVLDGKKIIFLNGSDPLGRQYYTAAHEYCHILRDLGRIKDIEDFSDEQKSFILNRMEHFAYTFADYFLLPEKALLSYLHNANIKDFSTIKVKDILDIQTKFRLSYRQVTRMLNKYNIISTTRRDELNKISSKENPDMLLKVFNDQGYDSSIVLPLKESKIPQKFLNIIIENIKYKRITRKKIIYLSELLNMPSLLEYAKEDFLQ